MCILTKIYSERCTICSSESVDSSLTHRLGADLPREKLGATAAMRCEEKQSAVRFHVPEAGINECCFVFSLYVPLSQRLVSYEMREHTDEVRFAHYSGTIETMQDARETLRLPRCTRRSTRPTTRERNPTATRRIVVQPSGRASRNSMVSRRLHCGPT